MPQRLLPRRQFIGSAAAAVLWARAEAKIPSGGPPLRLLILGGTQFIGVHMTQLALQRGHHVTLFNRGKSNPTVFPEVEKLRGDRNGQLDALRGRSWDAVIDDSGYVPRHVRLSAELLAAHVQRYLYISSISAYASFAAANDENSPLATTRDASIEVVNGDTYGPLKALCERAVAVAMPHRAIVLRPGFVVGPDDPTDRFTYWPARAARGGEMLAPGTPSAPVQFIDARDLARFALDSIERDVTGTFNVVAPPDAYTMGALIDACVQAAETLARPRSAPKPIWVSEKFLERESVDLPIWVPSSGDTAGFAQVSARRALDAGLRITPIARTVRDTLAWQLRRSESERTHLKAGLTPERERELLAAWASGK